MKYYMAVKKENLLFVTVWMDLEIILLSEISQSEKDKHWLPGDTRNFQEHNLESTAL